jgi:hypothetical protein
VSGLGFWADCAFGVELKPVDAAGAPLKPVGFVGCPNPPVAVAGWMNGEVLDDFAPKPLPAPKPVAAGCDD